MVEHVTVRRTTWQLEFRQQYDDGTATLWEFDVVHSGPDAEETCSGTWSDISGGKKAGPVGEFTAEQARDGVLIMHHATCTSTPTHDERISIYI